MVDNNTNKTTPDSTITENSKNDEIQNKTKREKIREIVSKYPRTHNLVVYVVVPMILLNLICFLCGHLLARAEKPIEIEANDAYLRHIFSQDVLETSDRVVATKSFQSLTSRCISLYTSSRLDSPNATSFVINNTNDMEMFINDCIKENGHTIDTFHDPVDRILKDESTGSLTYNWIACPIDDEHLEKQTSLDIRSKHSAVIAFNKSYSKMHEEVSLIYEHAGDMGSGNFVNDFMRRIETISGHDHCYINNAGGAFFWFTIMTTIGYGNTAPESFAGRAMVYTLGFISILLFAAVSGQAGYVSLSIADDFFYRRKMKSLTKGMGASVFWFGTYYLWNVVVGGMVMNWATYRRSTHLGWNEFKDAFWFAYISTTTVGFGDYFLHHEVIHYYDMMYLPLVLLLGFVFLANFLIKFAEWIADAMETNNASINVEDVNILTPLETETERKPIRSGFRRQSMSSRVISLHR